MGTEKLLGSWNRFAFKVNQKSPEILLISGIAGVVIATVSACRATLKANDILEEHQKRLDTIHAIAEDPESTPETTAVIPKATTQAYVETGLEFVKAYAPAIAIEAISIFAICKSHVIMKERNLALATALSASTAALTEYRERVRKAIGDEAEQMIFDGGHKEIVEKEVVDEKGKKKKVQEEVVVYDNDPSDFLTGFFFDESSKYWNKYSSTLNAEFLMQLEDIINTLRDRDGYARILDVIQRLGVEIDPKDKRLKYWSNFGWVEGDEFEPTKRIDFDLHSARNHDLMSGQYKPDAIGGIWLRFKDVVPLFGIEWSGK